MIKSEGVSFSGSGSQESVRYKQGGILKGLCEMWGVGGAIRKGGQSHACCWKSGKEVHP